MYRKYIKRKLRRKKLFTNNTGTVMSLRGTIKVLDDGFSWRQNHVSKKWTIVRMTTGTDDGLVFILLNSLYVIYYLHGGVS